MSRRFSLHRLKAFHIWIPISLFTIIASRLVSETGSVYSLLIPDVKSPQCMMREITGLSCGTCGMTSAFNAIAKGDLMSASLRHPLSVPLFFGIISLGFVAFLDIVGFRSIPLILFRFVKENMRAIILLAIAVLAAVYIMRMIGEIQSGYLKPDGLKKMMFFWYYMIKWFSETSPGR